jgi:VanZ family protein
LKTEATTAPERGIPQVAPPSGFHRFLRYWLPVILWMLFIFGLSTSAGAPNNSSRIIGPIVRWLVPGISDEALGRVVFGVRKMSHVTEYAVLAVLVWRARRQSKVGQASSLPPGLPALDYKSREGDPERRTGSVPSHPARGDLRPWQNADAVFAFVLATIFAATDEWHQSFVPSRQGSGWDVLLDSSGALLGLFAVWWLGRWRKRW